MRSLLSTAHPLEYVFFSISFIGFVAMLWALVDAQRYLNYMTARGVNGGMRLSAIQQIAMDMCLTICFTAMTITSIAFLFTAPPPPDYTQLPQSLIGMCSFIFISGILLFAVLVNLRIRKKLEHKAETYYNRRKDDVPIALTDTQELAFIPPPVPKKEG